MSAPVAMRYTLPVPPDRTQAEDVKWMAARRRLSYALESVAVRVPLAGCPEAVSSTTGEFVILPGPQCSGRGLGTVSPRVGDCTFQKHTCVPGVLVHLSVFLLRQVPVGSRTVAQGRVCNPRISNPGEICSPAGGSQWPLHGLRRP